METAKRLFFAVVLVALIIGIERTWPVIGSQIIHGILGSWCWQFTDSCFGKRRR